MDSKKEYAKSKLKEFIPIIDERIRISLDKELLKTEQYGPFAIEYIELFYKLNFGGAKRLRAAFVYYSYLMHGGKDFDAILDVCVAIEIAHLYLLVIDDWMDLSDSRRGVPTISYELTKKHKEKGWKGSSKHFGDSIATMVGLIFAHYSIDTLLGANFDKELLKRAINQLNRQFIMTAHGQSYDVLNGVIGHASYNEIINVLYWKTGIYTYDNPLRIGAILAGAKDEDLDKFKLFGQEGGVSFQIQDDILGTFGNKDKTGKSVDGDIKEGKHTLLSWKAYEEADKAQKVTLDKVLGNHNATDEEVEEVRNIFIDTGSLTYSRETSLQMVKDAKKHLIEQANVKWEAEGFDFLLGIADYMIEREI